MREVKFNSKNLLLGVQHLFAMFGATVLVPAITGLNPAVALITAGIGTIIFHLCTKGQVPVFVGSSFAFIAGVQIVMQGDPARIPIVQGGIICAGLVYVVLSILVRLLGPDRILKLFPPVVTGPVIVVIGLTLAPNALGNASQNWIVAIITLATVIVVSIFAKGYFKLVPILLGIVVGYAAAIGYDLIAHPEVALVSFSPILEADLISPFWKIGEFFTLPKFDLSAILTLAPIALVTFMEHVGDITTNGAVVGKNFLKDPGLHRTVLGDGLATIAAGLLGGPANTTYGENTGVLAVTKVYNPFVLELAAGFAILLGLFGKFGATLQTIPVPVMGGVSILLFGMIASIGIRTLAESNLDFSHSRNLIIVALILVVGLGLSAGVSIGGFQISGLFLAVVLGAVANQLFPAEV
ncbi:MULTISPECIES: uracil-xanthine permease family protein [Oscillospiraceae]|uniref:Uracil permease n=1 Tax=Harryflintia acetispora TaxID=1849041 RepID=A0A9X8ULH7_9FIRM|nr:MULTISPECIES: uracil-xanthine permease family protein [Oscillospiraceae]TCL45389.1 uracil permease [Harryflintia acetispora]